MDSMKAARIIGAVGRAVGIMEGFASGKDSRIYEEAKRLEREALEPLMEEYAKDD